MTEVIVYRTPLEALLWSGLVNGAFFPVLVGIATFFFVFIATDRALNRGRTIGGKAGRNTNIALGVGAAAGLAVMFYLAS